MYEWSNVVIIYEFYKYYQCHRNIKNNNNASAHKRVDGFSQLQITIKRDYRIFGNQLIHKSIDNFRGAWRREEESRCGM